MGIALMVLIFLLQISDSTKALGKNSPSKTERKILQLDRFSLLAVPVSYAVVVAIFIATWKS